MASSCVKFQSLGKALQWPAECPFEISWPHSYSLGQPSSTSLGWAGVDLQKQNQNVTVLCGWAGGWAGC